MPLTKGRRSRNNFKHLNLCFSNFKHSFTHESPPMFPSSKSCSFIQHNIDHNRPSPSTTITSSSIMIKNFNSLYDYQNALTLDQNYPLHSSFQPEEEPEPEPVDFATAFASQRFFFSSPGRSNSIIESTSSSSLSSPPPPPSSLWFETLGISSSPESPSYFWSGTLGVQKSHWTSTNLINPSPIRKTHLRGQNSLIPPPGTHDNNNKWEVLFNDSVAVPTHSPDPYLDFRRSMEEMVEAQPEVISNWEVLYELLQCYLALNCKSTHKFILGAFADLVVSLTSFSSSPDADDEGAASGGGGC